MLHLISNRLDKDQLNRIIELIDDTDAFIMYGEGIYGFHELLNIVHYAPKPFPLYFIEEDALARGYNKEDFAGLDMRAINYEQFVQLTLESVKTITW